MISIKFNGLHADVSDFRCEVDVLLRIVAELLLIVEDRVVYQEVEFPVVELAFALRDWIEVNPSQRGDFNFESMESTEVGLIQFRSNLKGWKASSVHGLENIEKFYNLTEIDQVVHRFIGEVHERVLKKFNVDIKGLRDFLSNV